MAKSMKNTIRAAATVSKEREELIVEALKQGHTTRKTISKATGIDAVVVSMMLSNNQDLRNEWIVKKRMMVDVSVDNINDIINDSEHKDHFQASKWVASNIDSELSSILFPTSAEMEIQVGGEHEDTNPVVIKFTGGQNKI
jgi:hypothetical protein